MVEEDKQLYLKACGRIQKAKIDAEAAAKSTMKSVGCGKEEELCFNKINKAVKDHSAKSKKSFELLYKLVEDLQTAVSHKSKKCQWKYTVTENNMFQYTQ